MLNFVAEGWLELEGPEIIQLFRSAKTVTLAFATGVQFNVNTVLCRFRVGETTRTQVAFSSRTLNKALLFDVQGESGEQTAQTVLAELNEHGFQMEKVDLNLSSALRQVVLQNTPGVMAPQQARKKRHEAMALLAEMEDAYQEDPESPDGKKAKRKLDAERRLNEQATVLQGELVEMFVPRKGQAEGATEPGDDAGDLAALLTKAEAAYESEYAKHRETADILAAAEKRIQELEKTLVTEETKSAASLRDKRDMIQVEARIKTLETELGESKTHLAEQEQLLQKQIQCVETAENQLAEHVVELAKAQELIAQHQAGKKDLDAELKEAAQQMNKLEKKVQRTEKAQEKSEKALAATEAQAAELTAERDEAVRQFKSACTENKTLQEELRNAEQQCAALQQEVEVSADKAKTKSGSDDRINGLRERLEALEASQEATTVEMEQERSIRKRLEKGAIADEKRIAEMEAALAEAEQKKTAVNIDNAAKNEITRLQESLDETRAQAEVDAQALAELEQNLGDAHALIEKLEKTLKVLDKTSAKEPVAGVQPELQGATQTLKIVEAQLEQERVEQKKISTTLLAAEKRISELEDELQKSHAGAVPAVTEENKPVAPAKPLPHEVRPAPKKGAEFSPDWDLEGLPCSSVDQVVQAWESVFNVQLSLEGYPAQYCSAFLVIIRNGKKKQLFMLFRLKKNNHTLVCVPAKEPTSDAALKKAVQAGKKFLQLSGFELELLAPENVAGMLTPYFLGD